MPIGMDLAEDGTELSAGVYFFTTAGPTGMFNVPHPLAQKGL